MSTPMSRGKLRTVTEVCADCGALDPSWASVNRGVLICEECCSIHRSLGRHISQVKSLKKGSWSPTLLQMVHTLNNNGVNSIWEHTLLDPTHSKSGRRKPQPKDFIHPTKADFIRAKYQMLAFVFRPGKDDTLLPETDLSKQLHSSVRTANLETSLRLLSQGADPNFFHQEKDSTPLHVAARAGQALQAELLVVYGADPGALNSQGRTPADIARAAGHRDLADRLIESMYELTDRLAYFLCSRKPDHHSGQHFIVPEMSDSLDITELAKVARKKLQRLPNHLFEELAMDVYDEVDRRETEDIWVTTQHPTNPSGMDRCAVPFLPVNPEFSSTRNQGRQKLARFNAREFATLVIDILSDAKRRQSPSTSSLILTQDKDLASSKSVKSPYISLNSAQLRKSEVSDDEPLYDSVASDEDYITAEQIAALAKQAACMKQGQEQETGEKHVQGSKEVSVPNSEKASASETAEGAGGSIVNGEVSKISRISLVEHNFKKQLVASEVEMNDLKTEIRNLRSRMDDLVRENCTLRGVIQRAGLSVPTSLCTSPMPNGHENEAETDPVLEAKAVRGPSQRPASMYETREGLLARGTKWDRSQNRDIGDYDCPSSLVRPVVTQSLYQCPEMPPSEEVVRRTDQVTKRIQELWASMQDPDRRDAFVPCAERIRVAVAELTAIFPQNPSDENVSGALRALSISTSRLQTECAGLQRANIDSSLTADKTYFLQQVRSCAYDIAKATKQLVTKFQF